MITTAQLQGLRIKKVPEAGRWVGPMFRPINGWTDFMLITQDGKVAFFDAKSSGGDRFPYAQIERNQLDFLRSIGDLVPAGYLVYFRPKNLVVFYNWETLASVVPKSSLEPGDGLIIGSLSSFRLENIFLK